MKNTNFLRKFEIGPNGSKEPMILIIIVVLSILAGIFFANNSHEEITAIPDNNAKNIKIINENMKLTNESVARMREEIIELERSMEELKEMNSIIDVKIESRGRVFNQIYQSTGKLFLDDIPVKHKLYVNDEIDISNIKPNNVFLGEPSYFTSNEINKYLEGTRMEGLGGAFIKAELTYDINSAVLMAIAIHESGWGGSQIAMLKNNLFGYKAYDSSPYTSAGQFQNTEDGVMHVARELRANYINKNGKYNIGNASLNDINQNYASDKLWAVKITATVKKFVKSTND